jgi:hypothetical protein
MSNTPSNKLEEFIKRKEDSYITTKIELLEKTGIIDEELLEELFYIFEKQLKARFDYLENGKIKIRKIYL